MNRLKKIIVFLLVAMMITSISTVGYGAALENTMSVETESKSDAEDEIKEEAEEETSDEIKTEIEEEIPQDTQIEQEESTEIVSDSKELKIYENEKPTEDSELSQGTKEKEFLGDSELEVESFEGSTALMSADSLSEVEVSLVLNGKSENELAAYSVDEMINSFQDSDGNKVPVKGNPTTVWRYVKDSSDGIEEYRPYYLNNNEVIDLSIAASVSVYKMELIIGNGSQLNTNNVRYIVTVYISDDVSEQIGLVLYEESDSGIRKEVAVSKKYEAYNNDLTEMFKIYGKQFEPIKVITYVVPGYTDSSQYYLGITSEAAKHPNRNVEVYTFAEYMNYLVGSTTTITDQILNQNMMSPGTGYKGHFRMPVSVYDAFDSSCGYFFVVEKDSSGTEMRTTILNFYIIPDETNVSYVKSTLFAKNGSNITDVVCREANSIDVDSLYVDIESGKANGAGVHEYFYMLKKGVNSSDEHYCRFNAHGSSYGEEANKYVKKAVVGLYNSIDDAKDERDIKDQLFPTDPSDTVAGYKANYDYANGGVYFTAFFDDGSVWKFNVRTMDYDPRYDETYVKSFTEAPVIGAKDPWFRVEGAANVDGSELPTYSVENGKSINMDTMYGYGYQTIFINNPDVTEIVPIIEKADGETVKVDRVYIDGAEYNEGTTIKLTGLETTVQFNVVIKDENGEHTKNYNVSFVKSANGPKLFVSDPKGGEESDPVRSVFLDEYFEYKHDIFIANIGDQELTGLRVELDATNVKLDDYWTIGGENSDALAPFTADPSVSNYAELPNAAKIRLLPDGEGDIEGKLTIYADNQEPVVIKLSGRAQNPSITTGQLKDAVKYVPYSYMITTNNMYDWNSVSFSYKGEIPDGMTLNESTGEIYGAPLRAGTYSFTITAEYGRSDYFEASTKDFTITVLDNENETVFKTSDEGYDIIPEEDGANGYVGEQVSDYDFVITSFDQDEVFISEGEYEQFVKLWLNGEELEEGVDYITEPGSTKITIKSQTLEKKTNDERNTISAEFNINNERGENLKRTSQNFRVDLASKDITGAESLENNGTEKPTTVVEDANYNSADTVNVNVHAIDADGNDLVGYIIEMHSTVQTSTTDASGKAYFSALEMGTHTAYVKNAEGTTLASKNFSLVTGLSLSINGDTITVVPGQTIDMTIKVDGSVASIESVGNVKTNKASDTAGTGDASNADLWILLVLVSSAVLLSLEVMRRKSISK